MARAFGLRSGCSSVGASKSRCKSPAKSGYRQKRGPSLRRPHTGAVWRLLHAFPFGVISGLVTISAAIPWGGGNGIKARRHSSTHAHRPAPGEWRVYSKPGEGDAAAANATKARYPTKKLPRIEDKVNSHSILSKLCFPKVPVPSGRCGRIDF